LRRERRLSYRIEIDGGVSEDNVGEIASAGCDIIVAGSSIFGRDDPAAAVAGLLRKVEEQAFLRA
ncbi:MAG: ribulose-phosphate 3-epimerase, partial [Acidobacteriia bacterium]|nr:ribulose-phosphate 3-epimerase [Terriglobia bacterium]